MPPPTRRRTLGALTSAAALPTLVGLAALLPCAVWGQPRPALQSWPLGTARPTGIHDLAPAPDGGVWFTAQRSGHLGWFDPATGRTELIALGGSSSPHGVIQGPDKAAWITDVSQNAVVRVAWPSREKRVFPLPEGRHHLGQRMGRQRDAALRPGDREVHPLRIPAQADPHPPDSRPPRRGLAAGERHRAHFGDSHRLSAPPGPTMAPSAPAGA